jgi:hypothetical protein
MWMSLARWWSASWKVRVTRRTIGASASSPLPRACIERATLSSAFSP